MSYADDIQLAVNLLGRALMEYAEKNGVMLQLSIDVKWNDGVPTVTLDGSGPDVDYTVETEMRRVGCKIPAMELLRELRNARPLLLYGDEWIERINKVLENANG